MAVPQLLHNPPGAPWIVQKFGGASLGEYVVSIVEDIVKPSIRTSRTALVFSALSTATTSQLLHAVSPDDISAISKMHLALGKAHLSDPAAFEAALEGECGRLRALLAAAQVLEEVSVKTRDAIVGVGERVGCHLLVCLLKERGVDAEFVNLENLVRGGATRGGGGGGGGGGDGGGLGREFCAELAAAMQERVAECGDRIPVVTGFFGAIPGSSLLATVGSGYTDVCASLLSTGIAARELRVWGDAEGVFTADPARVSQARLIPSITPGEAAELAGELVDPLAMELVVAAGIPVRVGGVGRPGGGGTMIVAGGGRGEGVRVWEGVTVVSVHGSGYGFLAGVFEVLQEFRVEVVLVATSEVIVSIAMRTGVLAGVVRELERLGKVEVRRGMAVVAVVGRWMKKLVGVAGKMLETLAGEGINVVMISQGANEINISCVIRESDALKAMTVLHTKLFLHSGGNT